MAIATKCDEQYCTWCKIKKTNVSFQNIYIFNGKARLFTYLLERKLLCITLFCHNLSAESPTVINLSFSLSAMVLSEGAWRDWQERRKSAFAAGQLAASSGRYCTHAWVGASYRKKSTYFTDAVWNLPNIAVKGQKMHTFCSNGLYALCMFFVWNSIGEFYPLLLRWERPQVLQLSSPLIIVESREQQLSSSRVSLTKIRKSSSSPWRPQKLYFVFFIITETRTCLRSHGRQTLSCDLSQSRMWWIFQVWKTRRLYSNFRFHSRRQKSPSGPVISSREEISSRESRNCPQ